VGIAIKVEVARLSNTKGFPNTTHETAFAAYVHGTPKESRSPTCYGSVSEGTLPILTLHQGAYSTTQESGPERARSKHASCRSAGNAKIG
jgi:hypothetical protein